MVVPQDDIDFGLGSSRYRRKSSGEYLAGPPRDFDGESNRFRGQSGRFKDQSAYGADNVRDTDPDREFLGSGGPQLSTGQRMTELTPFDGDIDVGGFGEGVELDFDGL